MQKTRIGRIAKGETVVVPMLSEELQDLYWKQTTALQDYRDAMELAQEERTTENLKAVHRLDAASDIARANFWLAVREKYQIWDESLGIRDGFAVVTFKSSPKIKSLGLNLGSMPDSLKDFLKKMIEEEDEEK